VGDWRKSTYSDATGGQCVEVASTDGVTIRDTANPNGYTLAVSANAWTAFLTTIR
jgi:hypothetical protein